MENIKLTIGQNLIKLRKQKGLTQLELAEKFNYSDKSVSKWERGEATPDIEIIKNLAEFYGVSVDCLLGKTVLEKEISINKPKAKNPILISFLSASIVWIVATVAFFIGLAAFNMWIWQLFMWAVPATFIVLIVFNGIWGRHKFSIKLNSFLTWTVIGALFFQLLSLNINAWPIFLVGVPLELAIVLFAILKNKKHKI